MSKKSGTVILLLFAIFMTGICLFFLFLSSPSEFGYISHTYAQISHIDDAPKVKHMPHVTQPIGKVENDNTNSYGTAFIIDDHTIISNFHVANKNIKKIHFKPQLNGKEDTSIDIKNRHRVADKDIVVMNTKQSLKQYNKYRLTSKRPQWFDKTKSFGYPCMKRNKKSQNLVYQTTYKYLYQRKGLFYVSGQVYHGSSGSPMLNSEGQVYGIASFNFPKPGKNQESRRISGGYVLTQKDIETIQKYMK